MAKNIELELDISIRSSDNCEFTLLDALREKGILLDSPCGGKGKCGKCKVRILREPDLDKWVEVLACQARGSEVAAAIATIRNGNSENEGIVSITVEVPDESLNPGNMEIELNRERVIEGKDNIDVEAIAIDLGTTTIAGALIGEDGKILGEAGVSNSQRTIGSDVISRIEAALNGKGRSLTKLVREDIKTLIANLAENNDEPIKKYISGNTAMLKLLKGEDVRGLALAPYSGRSELEILRGEDLELGKGDIYLLPGIGPFIGADILMGIMWSGLVGPADDKVRAFMDIGTNGEMAIATAGKLWLASTAAGPALEGADISCGMPAIPGAIEEVEIAGSIARVRTIGNCEPLGLCGSGVISAVSQLLKNGIIGPSGELIEEFFDEGYELAPGIYMNQDDIRKVQTAKAAIRAGLKVLSMVAGIELSEVDRLYISGGFGAHIDISDAVRIGLFPKELEGRAEILGNTSLKGAIAFINGEIDMKNMESLRKRANIVELAGNPEFQREYIDSMNF